MWIDNVLDEIGTGRYHAMQCLLLGGIMIVDGAEILISSSILGALQESWNLSDAQKSAMMSIIFVGVLFGGMLGGTFADIYGRKPLMLATFSGIFAFSLASAFARGPVSMLLCRLALGLCFGGAVPPCMGLLVESCPTAHRKLLINVGCAWYIVGELLASCLLMHFMPNLEDQGDEGWRYVVCLAAVPSILVIPFIACTLEESAHFLVAHGRRKEAVRVLAHMARINGAEEVAARLMDRGELELLATTPSGATEDGERRSWMEEAAVLLGRDYRSIVLGGTYVCFVVNLLCYGLNYALPQIFRAMRNELAPAWELFVSSAVDIPGFLLSMILLVSSRLGHRDCMMLLAMGAAVSSIGIFEIDDGAKTLWLALASCYLLKFVSSAWFSLVYVYLGEIFPSSCRCSAMALCFSGGRFGAIVAPVLFELLEFERAGGQKSHMAYFATMAVLSFGGAVASSGLFLGFELKDRALEVRGHDPKIGSTNLSS